MNLVESSILKRCRISKSCYHSGDLEGNDVRRIMAQGCIIFVEIGQHVKVHAPENMNNNEIDEVAPKRSNACYLMDSVLVRCIQKEDQSPMKK